MRAQSGEFVRVTGEGQASESGDFGGGSGGEFRVGIQSRAYRRAADGEVIEPRQDGMDPGNVPVNQAQITTEFLTKSYGGGVLKMRAADFDNVVKFRALFIQRIPEVRQSREEPVHGFLCRRNVHGGRESVIGGLGHVYVVIGMDRRLAPHAAAGPFDGAVGDDLIGIHVRLGAGAGLPDAEGKMGVQGAGDDFISGRGDHGAKTGGHFPEVGIDQGAGFFENPEGADQGTGHHIAADGKILQGALRLGTPVGRGGDFDGAHGIGFGAGHDGKNSGGD